MATAATLHDILGLRRDVMTIDERLEKLAERHEALAQTVELLGHRVEQLVRVSEQDGENIRALARIAEIHERRITHLEGDE
jgi:archaellum component FlaC